VSAATEIAVAARRETPTGRRGLLARSGNGARVGLLALAGVTVLALLAPWLTPYDPMLRVGAPFMPPSAAHPFGTDEIGRDLASRVILGLRLTWLPGLGIILAGVVAGAFVGAIAGAAGGWVDAALLRLIELFLVLPSTLIALAVLAALGPGTLNMMIAMTLFWWPWYARIARAEVRAQASRPHAEAARLAGVSGPRLLWRYLLPGAAPALLVTATLDVANVILVLSLFSFLGLGATAPAPELGAMTAASLDSLTAFWWLPIMPAVAIFALCLAANLAGDALRGAMRAT
jgi:peptide/nickel transport system permease protein